MSSENGDILGQDLLIQNASPSHEDTFKKSDPTPVKKYCEENYGSLNEELDTMRAMNQVIPDHVPDIIDYEKEDGVVTEIEYEKVNGKTINEIMNGYTGEDLEITREDHEELGEIVETLHENGIAHGDLNRNNIIYGEDDWKLIDPAGIMEDDPDYDQAKNDDLDRLSRVEGLLTKSRHQPEF